MSEDKKLCRRGFIKAAGGAGLLGVLGGSSMAFGRQAGKGSKGVKGDAGKSDPNEMKGKAAEKKAKYPQVPMRALGKLGVEVPMLSIGGMFDIPKNQIVMKKAYDWGVKYWDTAHGYQGGKSEEGIGMYLKANPEIREDIFLVTKASGAKRRSAAEEVKAVEERLQLSLRRMNTDYIDLYYGVHGLSSPDELKPELIEWSKEAKKRGLIKFFGFSTHSNMARNLKAAAEMEGVDAIMLTYNFREMQKEDMQEAIDACYKKGIGLIAMKTQARGARFDSEADKKLTDKFLAKGYTAGQTKLKAVWDDERIAAICSQMPNIALLVQNVSAALDQVKLDPKELAALQEYGEYCDDCYCGSCEEICGMAVAGMPYTRDIIRYLMYYNVYGQRERARESFSNLPWDVRQNVAKFDYSEAERRCPQRLAISQLMKEASEVLA